LTFLTAGLSAAIGVGGSSLLSQAIGSGDADTQKSILGSTTGLSIIAASLLMIVCITYAPEMIGILGGEGEILELGVLYYRITLYGAFFRIQAVAVNMLIRAEGKVQLAMGMSITAALSNIALNYLFMGVLGWGIAGAAWATVISMVVLTILGYGYYFLGKANYSVNPWQIKLPGKLIKPLLAIGISAAMLQIMFFVQQSVVFLMIKKYGGDWDIAFMGTSYRVMLLMMFPSFGFAIAFQPVAGINFGAKNIDRVGDAFQKFVYASVGTIIIPYILIMFFPSTVIGWILPDATLSSDDLFNFRVMMASVWVVPAFFMGTTLFQATGEAKVAGLLTVFRDLILFVPFVIILPIFFGVSGIYLTRIPINLITIAVVVWIVNRQFRIWRAEMESGKL